MTETSITSRVALLSVEDAASLDPRQVAALSARHQGSGTLRMMRLLGFDRVLVDAARDVHLITRDGRRVLDMWAGFGSLAVGHNHPRVLAVRRRFAECARHELAMAFPSQYAAVLAANLAAIAPGDLDIVHLCCTGSEAVEAALRLAERAAGASRPLVAYAERSFHGRTRGALSITDSPRYRSHLRVLTGGVRVPFGDADALDRALRANPRVGTVVLETVQGGAGVVTPPPGYLAAVRETCDRHAVLWVADEVQCGMGRTGRFFAFEHAGVVPDVVVLAKSLGGGKAAVGAVIARNPVYRRAAAAGDAALVLGGGTFGGSGEACATAIETLAVLHDEDLIGNADRVGAHLLDGLRAVAADHPDLLPEVRGQGLMIGLRMAAPAAFAPSGLRGVAKVVDNRLSGGFAALVGSLLLAEHDILVAFTEYDRNVLRLEPPLTLTVADADRMVSALRDVLAGGIARMVRDYLRSVRHRRSSPV